MYIFVMLEQGWSTFYGPDLILRFQNVHNSHESSNKRVVTFKSYAFHLKSMIQRLYWKCVSNHTHDTFILYKNIYATNINISLLIINITNLHHQATWGPDYALSGHHCPHHQSSTLYLSPLGVTSAQYMNNFMVFLFLPLEMHICNL